MIPLDVKRHLACCPGAGRGQTTPRHQAPVTTSSPGNCVLLRLGRPLPNSSSPASERRAAFQKAPWPSTGSSIKGLLLALKAHHGEEPPPPSSLRHRRPKSPDRQQPSWQNSRVSYLRIPIQIVAFDLIEGHPENIPEVPQATNQRRRAFAPARLRP